MSIAAVPHALHSMFPQYFQSSVHGPSAPHPEHFQIRAPSALRPAV